MKVSVLINTYNHEKFISQAIEGALMQKTNFEYEIVIADDCSTDRTREIVVGYANRFPEIIRPLLHKENLFSQGVNVFVTTLKECKGQYIAMCEGDDYWTDSYKLQKQVDFLDCHPECAMCFHSVERIFEDGHQSPSIMMLPKYKKVYTLEDLLEWNFISTGSVLFRKGLFGEFPEWYYTAPYGDYPLFVLNAHYGNIGFINKVMGVYRVHSGGVYSSTDGIQRIERFMKTYDILKDNLLDPKYHKKIKEAKYRYYYELFLIYLKKGDIANARKYVKKGVLIGHYYERYVPYRPDISYFKLLRMLFRVYAPILHGYLSKARKQVPLVSRILF